MNIFKPVNEKTVNGKVKKIFNDIKKTRYVDDKSNQMVMRVDEHDYCEEIDNDMLKYVVDNKFDAIIISDYCKGFLLEEDIQYICDNCDNVFIDTKKRE